MKLKPIKRLEEIENFEVLKKFLSSKYGQKLIDRGKLAEFYCEELFGLKKNMSPNREGYDLESEDGKRIEVKNRDIELREEDYLKTKWVRITGMPIDLDKIDYVLYVLFDKDLLPKYIFQIPKRELGDSLKGKRRVSFKKALDSQEKKRNHLIFQYEVNK